ncbi:ATP-binding protein [Amycolatopsis minnesotensis]|uniref:ATP-binding protein n=1 Tax=Amycolatopsis minnesotensis TaxID=337894 RepID=UPI0031D8E2A9
MRRTGWPALVGRADELAEVTGILAGGAGIVLLGGEAGIGKTRLVEELVVSAERTVLAGRCARFDEPVPFGPIVDAVRNLENERPVVERAAHRPITGALRRYLPEIADWLPPEPREIGDAPSDRHTVFRAFAELLRCVGPVLLIIEDAQWADEQTRRLLRYLSGDVTGQVSAVVTYRPEEVDGEHPLARPGNPGPAVAHVRLGPLTPGQVHELASAIAGTHRVSGELARELFRLSGGNPLVVKELLRAKRHPVTGWDSSELFDVPQTVADTMRARTAALRSDAKLVVDCTAVLDSKTGPGSITTEVLTAVTGLPPDAVRAGLVAAVEANVLTGTAEGGYGFRHAVARRAVYEAIPGPRRETLHRRAFDAIEGTAAELAEHARHGGLAREYGRYAELAADEAIAQGDGIVAVRALLRLAVRPGTGPADLDRIAGKIGEVAPYCDDRVEAIRVLERTLALPGLADRCRGLVRTSLGQLLLRQVGGVEAGRLALIRAAAELADFPELAARTGSYLAKPLYGATPLAAHLPWMRKVDAAIRRADDTPGTTFLLANNVGSWLDIGDPHGWSLLARLPEAPRTDEEQRDVERAYNNAADACAWTGRYRDGLRLIGMAFGCSTAGGQKQRVASRSTKLHLDWLIGAWDGLAARAGKLRAGHPEIHGISSEASMVLGFLAAAKGDWTEASALFGELRLDRPENLSAPIVLAGYGGLVRLSLAREQFAEAAAHADRAVEFLRHKGIWAWAGEVAAGAAEAYCRAGRADDARVLAGELAASLPGIDAPAAATALRVCRAVVHEADGEHTRAREEFDAASRDYDGFPAPYFAAQCAEQAAAAGICAGDEEATARLSEVAARFEALGATRDAARCRHRLRAAGGFTPSRRGRNGYGRSLSPREAHVAELLAKGHTNREISEVLLISVRTVEQHVARVLRKLDVDSRGAVRESALVGR